MWKSELSIWNVLINDSNHKYNDRETLRDLGSMKIQLFCSILNSYLLPFNVKSRFYAQKIAPSVLSKRPTYCPKIIK